MLHKVSLARSLITGSYAARINHPGLNQTAAICVAARCKQREYRIGEKGQWPRRHALAWPCTSLETDVSCMIHCNCQRPGLSIHPWRGRLSGAPCSLSNRTMHVRCSSLINTRIALMSRSPTREKSATAIDWRTFLLPTHHANYTGE